MENIIQFPSKVDSARLDALVARLRETSEKEDHTLLIEHLETAHAYHHGAMTPECRVNLELAREAALDLSDKELRRESKQFIDEMLENLAAAPVPGSHPAPEPLRRETFTAPYSGTSATALELTGYFHGSGAKLGTFYPTKHMLAVLETLDLALGVRQRLSRSGFSGQRVLAVSGEEFAKFLDDQQISRSLQATVMNEVSRILDTEANLVDQYLSWARLGCGFLIAYSPTESTAWQISGLLAEFNPLAANWYSTNSIHRFT